jgi:very-short-patch-repair endonuclease
MGDEMERQAQLLAFATRQHGLVAVWQVIALGGTRDTIKHMVRSGNWERLTPMVLRRCGAPHSDGQRALAAVLDAGRRSGLSHHPSAAWFAQPGFRLFPLHVIRQRDATSTPSRLATVHEPRTLPDHHLTTHRGVPVTVPSRIPFDIAALGDVRGAERALDRAWTRHLLNYASVTTMLSELAGKGRKGITLMRELLAERGPDYRPNDTGVEDRFQELARPVGFRFERQRNLCDMGEWLGRVDFVDEKRRLVAEVDSALYHDALIDEAADAVRQAALEAAGYRVERFTDHEIFYERDPTVQRLWNIRRSGA